MFQDKYTQNPTFWVEECLVTRILVQSEDKWGQMESFWVTDIEKTMNMKCKVQNIYFSIIFPSTS
jgi:hypothetical protein